MSKAEPSGRKPQEEELTSSNDSVGEHRERPAGQEVPLAGGAGQRSQTADARDAQAAAAQEAPAAGREDAQAAAAEPGQEERIAELEAERRSLQDELLRKAADLENFRKRMFRDKEEAIRYANADLLNDVLPIIDDFERAIQSAGESKDFEAFHAGVSLIERQLVSVLERNWGLKRFSADGEIFDPERHEAIAAEETREHEDPVVLEEYQKGYTLHERVLRPAKVKVAKPAPPKGSGGNDV